VRRPGHSHPQQPKGDTKVMEPTAPPTVVDRGEAEGTDGREVEDGDVHQDIEGNEEADRRAKREVRMGIRMHKPDIATLAGIRQAHPIHPKAPKHLRWSRQALWG